MKLLIINTIKEYQSEVIQILKNSQVPVFSITETRGFKNEIESFDISAWFGNQTGDFDSLVIYSFTEEDKARKAIELINKYNETHTRFPLRGFMLPVELSTT